MAAGTYIKFIGASGTLTGTNGTIWAEAVDPDYAQTLEAELQSDQGSGVPTIAMPLVDSGVAAAVQAAAAHGTLGIEVAGYNDQGQLTNDIVLGTTTVGSETVTTEVKPVAQTLSVQPTIYASRTTSYDSSGTATTSSQGYNFKTGTTPGAPPANIYTAPADPTSIASAATADAGVMPYQGTYITVTTADGTLQPASAPPFSVEAPGNAIKVNQDDLISVSGLASNLTNASGAASGSLAFTSTADAENPALLAAFFQGTPLASVSVFQTGGTTTRYVESETTFDALQITNLTINLAPNFDYRTYQLQTAQPLYNENSTYTVTHIDPSGNVSTQSLTLAAGTPGVGQVSATPPSAITGDYTYAFDVGSGSSAPSYVLDDASISFSSFAGKASVSPLSVTFANAADASAVIADLAAGGQTFSISANNAMQGVFDVLTFRTAGGQAVSGETVNADGSVTFSFVPAAYGERYTQPEPSGSSEPPSSGLFASGINTDGTSSFQQVCYVGGTRIRTDRGDVVVEHLAIGDLVVTASGDHRPIRWLGHRTIDCLSHPSPHDAHPVRISAHAFAPNQPVRDLFLSPGHPVLVGADEDNDGGHLVPIMCLINGTTVRREAVDEVTYWHVELDAHDILLAENLPAESYIDLGSRPWFAGADGVLFDPDMAAPGLPGRCRPVAIDGPMVEAERRRLDGLFATSLAAACAWPGAGDPLPAM